MISENRNRAALPTRIQEIARTERVGKGNRGVGIERAIMVALESVLDLGRDLVGQNERAM